MKIRMKNRFAMGFCGAVVIASFAGSIAVAQDVDEGRALYERYCATCHGIEATGKGPMAGALLIQPTDLTKLVENNAGHFPLLRVVRRIDGRDPLVSHGSPMPVYGDFFEGDDTSMKTENGQPVMTSRAIADLVAYFQQMQGPVD